MTEELREQSKNMFIRSFFQRIFGVKIRYLSFFVLISVVMLISCKKQVKLSPTKAKTPFYNIYLDDMRGMEHSFRSLRGKVVFVDFFASQCTRCLYIIPHLKKMQTKYRHKGFVVLGIALESPKQPMLRSFVKYLEIDYSIFIASKDIFEGKTVLGRINRIPQHQIIDRCGRIRKRYIGVMNPTILQQYIEKLLKESSTCH